jgi:hypothetical protein
MEEYECEHAPLASNMVFDYAFKRLISPADVSIYYRKDSNEAEEQLVALKAGNLR